ncbi:MAG: cupin domain-containing protein [Bauldia sp.]|nr:cupin domain-containing protein [Bauldia sp.]
MSVSGGNLFSAIRPDAPDEEIRELLMLPGVRIERIVSTGQSSPEGFWYDQDFAEWVVLLVGAAQVSIEGEDAPRHLGAGDYLFIPARTKHRVDWTDPSDATIWLAIHLAAV